jgi:sec-independent protein translocase protein TatC
MSSPSSPTTKDPKQMGLLEHIYDLRYRLMWIFGILAVTTTFSFFFAQELLLFLLRPYGLQLQVLSPTEGLEIFFKVSLMSGFILAMPFILYHLWRFLEPAIEENEKKYIYIFIPSGLALFLLGILFAWFILVPAAVGFLATFMPTVFATEWTGSEYISFILSMLFWMGLSFEMPIVLYFLARSGVLDTAVLITHWRYAVVAVAILAAIITPSIDPITMLLTMAPLLILYFFSIGIAKIGQRQFQRQMSVDDVVPNENG